ncbi:MAG TPA: hypothetical protein ENN88_00960 [Candidatus Coatesbacteria bacterium]|nr:hypothetical protein [Candidatus Coatesbacteria bacterium]
MDCERREANLKLCNCTYSCDKHGRCCECLHYHRRMGELPACYFDAAAERTWNRTLAYFVSLQRPRG